MFEENKEGFRKWLIKDKKLSTRVAGDVLSRCKRLNNAVLESIDLSVSTPEVYLESLHEIKEYTKREKESQKARYNLNATLNAAMKKYCEYMNPQTFKNYPNVYVLIRNKKAAEKKQTQSY